MTVCCPTSSIVARRRPGEGMFGMGEHDQLVAAERDRLQAAIGRLERQDTEVEAAIEDLGRNLARPHAPDLDERLRVRLGETVEEGQQRVHGRLVGANDDAPAANLLQLAHRDFRVGGERQQPPGVLLKQASRFGQGAVADGPIEQSIAELFLEAADRLAHGRLGAMQLLGGDREAAFRRNRDKCAQILQLHVSNYNLALFKSNKYKLDSRLEPGLQRTGCLQL